MTIHFGLGGHLRRLQLLQLLRLFLWELDRFSSRLAHGPKAPISIATSFRAIFLSG